MNNKTSFSSEDTQNIINEILELKCGYITKNKASSNLGLIDTKENKITITYVFRSMEESELASIKEKMNALQNGFTIKEIYTDPIWEFNEESHLLNTYKKLYFNEYKEYPKEEIWHSSIECSSIKKRIPDLDIISIGSNIKKYHTTEEVTYLSSWFKIYDLLIKLLENLSSSDNK